MIKRIVAGRVRREGAHRAVLETLIDRQDDHLAGAAEPAGGQQTGNACLVPDVSLA